MLSFLILSAASVSATLSPCAQFNNLFKKWNVITSGDMWLQNSDFEGRTWVGGTANVRNFAFGEKLGFKCTQDPVILASRFIASSGNLCGGTVAASSSSLAESVGSHVNCDYKNGRYCKGFKPITVNPKVRMTTVSINTIAISCWYS